MTIHRPAKDVIAISERELAAMTADMDDLHHDAMPKFEEELAEYAETSGLFRLTGRLASRRTFLLGLGAAGAAAALAACSSSKSSSSASSSATPANATPTTAGSSGSQTAGLTGDLLVAGFAAGLENTAVAVYQTGISAATAGKLGTVPPAVVTFAQTAQSHHKDHAAAWNSILTGAGKPAITGVDKTVMDGVVTPALPSVTNVGALAKLALELEGVAAATYLNGIDVLTSMGAIQKAISIQPVEMQHVAILNFALGQYPVPASFSTKDGARSPSDVIA